MSVCERIDCALYVSSGKNLATAGNNSTYAMEP